MWIKDNLPDLTGKTVIVTGANTGIGFETAAALYEAGAQVILACRDLGKATEAIATIQQRKGSGSLAGAQLDLTSLASIERFATEFTQQYQHLHVLINNAGVMIPPASKTLDGFELQFGVNHIGHFALTGRLYPLLKSTPGSRVVTVSSLAYLRGSIDFDNLHSEHSYDPMREYCQSKLANVFFALELQRRISASGDGVVSVAVQPGANKTELARNMTKEEYAAALERFGTLMEPWQGALPSLYAAASPEVKGGEFYGPDQDSGVRGYPAQATIAPHALDEPIAKRLWEVSEAATGVYYPAMPLRQAQGDKVS
jgi:NAD(P)-dependent dehydrogenase (short-subunit alcohol dehydrogenase family)